jgi:Uncharacterized protein conserved in bacteria
MKILCTFKARQSTQTEEIVMMTFWSLSSLPVTLWKNGKGETREIFRAPSPDGDFLWRASIATLQGDGPFSLFPGVDRVLLLLEGEPLWIRGDEIHHRLKLHEPWVFPGEWSLSTQESQGSGLDFNVMTQRSRATSEVKVISCACKPEAEGVACVLSGSWLLNGERLTPQSGAVWQNECPGEFIPQSADATLLLAEITRL